MKRLTILIIWFTLLMSAITFGCALVTKPNTIANTIGFVILVVAFYLSISTKCFTSITTKLNKKNDNNEK